MIHEIGLNNSILNHFLAEIRDVDIQKDSMRFRRNLERIAEILAYEMSKELHFLKNETTTPLGTKKIDLIEEHLVVASILRAGLTMHTGVLNYFDRAENAFISAYREESTAGKDEIKVHVEYLASPDLTNKTLVLVDPMLATGNSILLAIEALLKNGKPNQIHLISAIGSKEGVDHVMSKLPENTHLWIADIDEVLNHKAYIVPGLGDAGDLAYGTKL